MVPRLARGHGWPVDRTGSILPTGFRERVSTLHTSLSFIWTGMLRLRFWSSGTLLVDRWKILRRSWGGCIHGALSRSLVADQVPLLEVTLICRRLVLCVVVCCRRPSLRWPLVQCQSGKIGERKQVAIVPDAVRPPACECNPPKTPA